MSTAPANSTRFILSAIVGVAAAFLGLCLFGLLIGTMPTPPRWITAHPDLYVPALRLAVWLPIIALCAVFIIRIAGAKAARFGVIAGVFGLLALLVQLYYLDNAHRYSVSFAAANYWLEIALLVVLLPTVCALWQPHGT